MNTQDVARRGFLKGVLAAGTLAGGYASADRPIPPSPAVKMQRLCVKSAGVRGDGQTPEAKLLQEILYTLVENGGGIAGSKNIITENIYLTGRRVNPCI